MRLKCHGVVRYLKSLLPVPHLDCFADELFSCDGTKSFDKVLPLEILATHLRSSDTRVYVAEEIDIMCPSRLAEQFIGYLLPQSIPSCVLGGVTDLVSPSKACAWFEDMEIDSLIVTREIEPYMLDLLEVWRFNESLSLDILQNYIHFTKDFECLKLVQYVIEPGQNATPTVRDEDCNQGSVMHDMLADAGCNLKETKTMHNNTVEASELKPLDQESLLEQYSGQIIRNRELKDNAKNHAEAVDSESHIELLTELLHFDPRAFLLDKMSIKPNIEHNELQSAISPSCTARCLSLLDENSVDADTEAVTKHPTINTVKVLFELPEVLEEEFLITSYTLYLGAYVTILMKPLFIELEELDSRETPIQGFERLLVLPELTLDPSSFHLLPEPSFIPGYEAHLSEDVFKNLVRAKASPTATSASDCLYLDWHLSQMGHCNNYKCFHLQRRLVENEFRLTVPGDLNLGKRIPDHQLLPMLISDDDSKSSCEGDTECCYNTVEENSSANLNSSASDSMLNSNSFVYTAAKAVNNYHSDQAVLTEERNDSIPVRVHQILQAGFSPTAMDSVLTFMKHARQGAPSRDTKWMQLQENLDFKENHQGSCNTKDQSRNSNLFYEDVLKSTSGEKISAPNPSCSSGLDAASSYDLKTSDHIQRESQMPISTPLCSPKDSLKNGIKSATPLQTTLADQLNTLQSEVENLVQSAEEHGPHIIIVVNVLQQNTSILLQRRNSYQKILGLENEDLQVVEREMNLPVDLLLDPSTCLTIYTEEKLRSYIRSSEVTDELFSCAVDSVVNCHMKILSLSFQRWFMIFEGGLEFNSAILRIMNKLYKDSAGFQIHAEGFISKNPLDTDSLVLSCIKGIWKMSKRSFDSPMSEDLTEVESFLTNFPSLNPLSSHAILCLNIPIATFISWPLEKQIFALHDFNIREESLELLQTQFLSLHGKLEVATQQGLLSACPWPAASDIVASEVESHGNDGFMFFPPASEIVNCEVDEDRHTVASRERCSDLYSPSPRDSILLHPKIKQMRSCFLSGERLSTHKLAQRPSYVEDKRDCTNPNDVHDISHRWIRKRERDIDKNKNCSELESELLCNPLKVPNQKLYNERSPINKVPTSGKSTAEAFSSNYRGHATDELLLFPMRKRLFLDLQGGVTSASQSQNKKLKPTSSTNPLMSIRPSSQRHDSLNTLRQSCIKFNSPFRRSV